MFPDAWIAFDTVIFSDQQALLKGLASASNMDLRENVYLLAAESLDLPLVNSALPPTGSVTIEGYHPDLIKFNVNASQTGILVYPDNNSSGWKVDVNGESSELLNAYGTFKGAIVPKGFSEVVMHYSPEPTLFAIKVALALVLAIICWGAAILMVPKFGKAIDTHIVI